MLPLKQGSPVHTYVFLIRPVWPAMIANSRGSSVVGRFTSAVKVNEIFFDLEQAKGKQLRPVLILSFCVMRRRAGGTQESVKPITRGDCLPLHPETSYGAYAP